VLKVAGAAVAVAATADAVAEAQTAGGKIKAIGFDAFTIFDVRSIDAAFEENFPGRARISRSTSLRDTGNLRPRRAQMPLVRFFASRLADSWRVWRGYR
jgi:hypothetical protein